MDAFVDSLVQLLIDWGYAGLFLSALLAGSILPFSSELVLVALVKLGLSPTLCVLSAAVGNTVGGLTCYYMGRLGKTEWIEKYFKVKQEKVERMMRFLQGKGALMAFFAFPDGLLRFPSVRGRSHCHRLGIHAQQLRADHPLHVCRKAAPLHCHAVGTPRGHFGSRHLTIHIGKKNYAKNH